MSSTRYRAYQRLMASNGVARVFTWSGSLYVTGICSRHMKGQGGEPTPPYSQGSHPLAKVPTSPRRDQPPPAKSHPLNPVSQGATHPRRDQPPPAKGLEGLADFPSVIRSSRGRVRHRESHPTHPPFGRRNGRVAARPQASDIPCPHTRGTVRLSGRRPNVRPRGSSGHSRLTLSGFHSAIDPSP
jgi:hypothetical protein